MTGRHSFPEKPAKKQVKIVITINIKTSTHLKTYGQLYREINGSTFNSILALRLIHPRSTHYGQQHCTLTGYQEFPHLTLPIQWTIEYPSNEQPNAVTTQLTRMNRAMQKAPKVCRANGSRIPAANAAIMAMTNNIIFEILRTFQTICLRQYMNSDQQTV